MAARPTADSLASPICRSCYHAPRLFRNEKPQEAQAAVAGPGPEVRKRPPGGGRASRERVVWFVVWSWYGLGPKVRNSLSEAFRLSCCDHGILWDLASPSCRNGVQGVAGSNPAVPTHEGKKGQRLTRAAHIVRCAPLCTCSPTSCVGGNRYGACAPLASSPWARMARPSCP